MVTADHITDTSIAQGNTMQISVLQENLHKGLSSVIKAIDARPSLPVLVNVLLEATDDGRLRIAASNLRMSVTIYIGAKVDRPGSITLPAKMLADLVGRLDKARVDLSLDEATNTVTITCGSTVSTIKGIAATEYPPIKQSENEGFTVSGSVLKSMIAQTVFAAAKENNRPILEGVYLCIDKDVLTLAAADGYRLAVRTARLDETYTGRFEMVVLSFAMLELMRLIDEGQDVCIALPDKKHNIVTFRLPNCDLSSQIIEGRFPDFQAIIPKRYATQAVVDTQAWLKACQMIGIFARDDSFSGRLIIKPARRKENKPFDFGDPAYLTMAGRSAERGHADNRLEASVNGDGVDAHFDIRSMIDVLNVIDEELVVFESGGNDSPGVFKPQGRDDFLYVLMPLVR